MFIVCITGQRPSHTIFSGRTALGPIGLLRARTITRAMHVSLPTCAPLCNSQMFALRNVVSSLADLPICIPPLFCPVLNTVCLLSPTRLPSSIVASSLSSDLFATPSNRLRDHFGELDEALTPITAVRAAHADERLDVGNARARLFRRQDPLVVVWLTSKKARDLRLGLHHAAFITVIFIVRKEKAYLLRRS